MSDTPSPKRRKVDPTLHETQYDESFSLSRFRYQLSAFLFVELFGHVPLSVKHIIWPALAVAQKAQAYPGPGSDWEPPGPSLRDLLSLDDSTDRFYTAISRFESVLQGSHYVSHLPKSTTKLLWYLHRVRHRQTLDFFRQSCAYSESSLSVLRRMTLRSMATALETLYFKGQLPHARRAEEVDALSEVNPNVMFFEMCECLLPRELMVEILSFLEYDRDLLLSVGLVSWDFFLLVLSSWKSVTIRADNYQLVPETIYRYVHGAHLEIFMGYSPQNGNKPMGAKSIEFVLSHLRSNVHLRSLSLDFYRSFFTVSNFIGMIYLRFFRLWKRQKQTFNSLQTIEFSRTDSVFHAQRGSSMKNIPASFSWDRVRAIRLVDFAPNLVTVQFPVFIEWCEGLSRLEELSLYVQEAFREEEMVGRPGEVSGRILMSVSRLNLNSIQFSDELPSFPSDVLCVECLQRLHSLRLRGDFQNNWLEEIFARLHNQQDEEEMNGVPLCCLRELDLTRTHMPHGVVNLSSIPPLSSLRVLKFPNFSEVLSLPTMSQILLNANQLSELSIHFRSNLRSDVPFNQEQFVGLIKECTRTARKFQVSFINHEGVFRDDLSIQMQLSGRRFVVSMKPRFGDKKLYEAWPSTGLARMIELVRLFVLGRDDVHSVLETIISQVSYTLSKYYVRIWDDFEPDDPRPHDELWPDDLLGEMAHRVRKEFGLVFDEFFERPIPSIVTDPSEIRRDVEGVSIIESRGSRGRWRRVKRLKSCSVKRSYRWSFVQKN